MSNDESITKPEFRNKDSAAAVSVAGLWASGFEILSAFGFRH
jgi:hypothetical protein